MTLKLIIKGCSNSSVQVKSLITGSDIHELIGHNSPVTSLAASNDCLTLFVACADSKLYLYDIRSRELIAVFMEQDSSINDLKISSDGGFLFSASGVYFHLTYKMNIIIAKLNHVFCFRILYMYSI